MTFATLLNHLWQSTAFAIAAGLLTLALRKNHARTRHWLWFAASVKFLVPFGVLAGLGAQVGALHPPVPHRSLTQAQISFAIEEAGAPFSNPAPRESRVNPLPGIWLLGCAAALLRWFILWRRTRDAARAATPLAIDIGVPVRASRTLLEPSVFGITRPVLLLPEGIEQRLDAAQLQVIAVHELCHIRRRDNLLAAIHMLVEAVFWFHPLVWWIGARLIEERERACDEDVLRLGNDPEVYAESILRACRFYLESPLACVSGVTGGELKRRIEQIMTRGIGRNLGWGRKALLAGAAVAAVAAPAGIGLLNAPAGRAQTQPPRPAPGYEVATIKPAKPGATGRNIQGDENGRLTTNNTTLKDLVKAAYQVRDFQLSGGPAWLDTAVYDIVAKPEGKSGPADFGGNIQKLLADSFQLKVHRETKEMSVYDLVIAKGGPKLKESDNPARGIGGAPGIIRATGVSMVNLARYLSQRLGRQVIDRTGLSGAYDFNIEFAQDEGPVNKGPGDGPPLGAADSSRGPSIFTAMQEQLGLRLAAGKGPVEVIVIDHAEKPSEN